jgi:hypothetical protein
LAEQQAEIGDADGAISSCLDAARASQRLKSNVTKAYYFLRMQAVARRVEETSLISHRVLGVVPKLFSMNEAYRRCLVAAWSQDLAELDHAATLLQTDLPRSNQASILARVHAEHAILAAKAGDIEAYRQARRTAANLIERKRAMPEISLLFAEADAHAGEFALSENSLGKKAMMWYGSPDRPRSTLVVRLAEAGRIDEAEKHYAQLSLPFWKTTAMVAISGAKAVNSQTPPEKLLPWIEGLDQPIDRVGAYCGLALQTTN